MDARPRACALLHDMVLVAPRQQRGAKGHGGCRSVQTHCAREEEGNARRVEEQRASAARGASDGPPSRCMHNGRLRCTHTASFVNVDYLCEAEGLRLLKEPPGGSNTRWPYWIDCADWFCPAGNEVRYENLFTYLLHVWLRAQGDEGI
eukprot:3148116-Prymnesium_polylepis.1